MKYEISTIAQLKAAIFDAIEKGVVLDKGCLVNIHRFDKAVGDYMDMCYEAGALAPTLPDHLTDDRLCEWYCELTGATALAHFYSQLNRTA